VYCAGRDNDIPTSHLMKDTSVAANVLVVNMDLTAPAFVAPFPVVAVSSATSLAVVLQVSKVGSAACIAVPAGSSAPTAAGVFASGVVVPVAAVRTNATVVITSLKSGAQLDVYCAARDNSLPASNVMPDAAVAATRTRVVMDVTLPVFVAGFPRITVLTNTTVTAVVSVSKPGTAACLAVRTGAPAPASATVLRAGSGAAIPVASTAVSLTLSGLTAGQSYDVYCSAIDTNLPMHHTMSDSAVAATKVTVDMSLTPPSFTARFPSVQVASATSIVITVQITKPGTVGCAAVINGALAPAAATVLSASTVAIPVPSSSATITISTGLLPGSLYNVYCGAKDNSRPVNNVMSDAAVAATKVLVLMDVSSPQFVSGFPSATVVSSTSVSATIQLTKAGSTACMAVPTAASAPTSAAIMRTTSTVVPSAATSVVVSVSGLLSGGAYTLYCSALDNDVPTAHLMPDALVQAAAVKIIMDTSTPVFAANYPQVTVNTVTDVSVVVQMSKNGTVICGAVGAGAAVPTYAVLAATGATSSYVARTDLAYLAVSGLTAGASYDVYCAGRDTDLPAPHVTSAATIAASKVRVIMDVTPPIWVASGSPAATVTTATSISMTMKPSKPGTVACTAVATAATAPTAAQVLDQGSSAAAASAGASATVALTGLTAGATYAVYCAAKDQSLPTPNLMSDALVSVPVVVDMVITPPAFVRGTPTVVGLTTSALVTIQLSVAGKAYCAAYASGAPAPSIASLQANGVALAIPTAYTPVVMQLSGLATGAPFDIYCAASDLSRPRPNTMATPAPKISTATSYISFLSNPLVTSPSPYSVTIGVTLARNGTAWCSLVPAASAQPSIATVRRGPTTGFVAGGVQTILTLSSLAASTKYDTFCYAQDSLGVGMQGVIPTGTVLTQVANCSVTQWSDWSSCDATCGVGVQTRSRTVVPGTNLGGQICPSLVDAQACSMPSCVPSSIVATQPSVAMTVLLQGVSLTSFNVTAFKVAVSQTLGVSNSNVLIKGIQPFNPATSGNRRLAGTGVAASTSDWSVVDMLILTSSASSAAQLQAAGPGQLAGAEFSDNYAKVSGQAGVKASVMVVTTNTVPPLAAAEPTLPVWLIAVIAAGSALLSAFVAALVTRKWCTPARRRAPTKTAEMTNVVTTSNPLNAAAPPV